MTYSAFPIADYVTGLFTAKEAWIAPKDAFQDMDNVALKRGRVEKRKGSSLVAYAVARQFTLAGAATDFEDSADLVEVGHTGHNLSTGDYIVFQGVNGTGASGLNDKRFFITKVDNNNFTLDDVTYSGLGLDGTTQDGTVDLIKALTKAGGNATNGQISAITAARPTVVTTTGAHGLSTGNTIQIVEEEGTPVVGMRELLNVTSQITVLSTTEFELDGVDSTDFNAYTSGGTVSLVDVDADPITGLMEYQKSDGTKLLLVATTTRLGKFTGDKANVEALSTSDQFSGVATDYFQFSTYGDTTYLTNNVDAPWKWTGSGAPSAFSFGSTGLTISRIILPYKQRIIALNNTEGGTKFPQRLRWTSVLTSPTATPDWDAGSALDASTQDEIIGAEFLKDTLVVYFSNSVWVVKDTGSADFPFRWEKVDDLSTLVDAQHSIIGHENTVWAFGRGGWIRSDGMQVQPFDAPIPDFPEAIAPDQKAILSSARNLTEKQIWMAYPCCTQSRNNAVLVYNYETPSFSEYDYDYNVASEFNKQTAGVTWNDIDESWDSINQTWDSFITRAGFPEMFVGTEAGFLRRVNEGSSDDGAAIAFDVTTSRLTPYPDGTGQLGWIDLLVGQNDQTEIDIEVYGDWDPSERVTGVISFDADTNGQDKIWKRFYVNLISPTFRVRMYHIQPEPFVLHAMVPYFRRAGRLV